jgi:hypothetical protein
MSMIFIDNEDFLFLFIDIPNIGPSFDWMKLSDFAA